MANDLVASRYDTGEPATYTEAGTGKTYRLVNGQKVYLSPRAVDGYAESGNPFRSGLLGGGGEWNTETGQFDEKSNALEKITLGAAVAPFAAFGAGALIPGGGSAASGAAAGGNMAPGGAMAASGGMPSWLGQALAGGVPALGRALSGPHGGPSAQSALSPEIMQLLQEFMRRQQQQGPLADATTARALGGLPRTR